MTTRRNAAWAPLICVLAALPATHLRAETAATLGKLKLDEKAEDTELRPIVGEKVKLSDLTKEGPLVLVVLRGFPGYQCPVCTQQVDELRKHANEFADLSAKVVLVCPGAAKLLEYRAGEFLNGEELPKPLMLVTDPDYAVTNLYGLRWNAAGETAYPATWTAS